MYSLSPRVLALQCALLFNWMPGFKFKRSYLLIEVEIGRQCLNIKRLLEDWHRASEPFCVN